MNFETDSISWSTPQKSSPLPFPTARENPVPTGSIMTRSALSSTEYSLFTRRKGPSVENSRSCTTVRCGPKIPICSHMDAEPGPPL